MSHLLRSFSRISFRSNSSSSSSNTSPKNINYLKEQENQTHEVAPKHNLFDEEDTLYVPETIKDKHNFDYIIKTVENNIPLGQDIGKEFHLLSKNSIYEHSRKYKYLHIGCVQVAIKPLIDMGIDATILMCLRDIRHNKFEDSLIGTVETSLGQGSVYFNYYPNKTVSLMDRNILDFLFLNIHFHGETTLFIIDMTKANVSLPRTIKWDGVTLPKKWIMDKVTPSVPRPAPTIKQIKQDNSGKVEITFNRRNSFSSRIQASRSEYESARRFFSVRTRSIPVGLTRSESHNQFPIVNLQGLDTTSSIPRITYNQEQEDDQKVKINVLFFDWFHAYTIKKGIDYPWKQDIIGDPTTNVITNWQIKDGELIQSELPPTIEYQLPKVKGRESIKTKIIPKHKTPEETPSNIPIEKPLFKRTIQNY
ncbi:hypothetical protein GYH30_033170 [Glycine max]|uniref:Polyprotein n=1 Tax=Glycine max TaxID=3847 RepID=A0A0R0HBY8_SOYBN|nr:hypothetical protein GYH30_033170 [Glycine max]